VLEDVGFWFEAELCLKGVEELIFCFSLFGFDSFNGETQAHDEMQSLTLRSMLANFDSGLCNK
jgi:hypothetical protein